MGRKFLYLIQTVFPNKKNKILFYYGAGLLLLVSIGLIYLRSLESFLDLEMQDEALYMAGILGPKMSQRDLLSAPLFSGFYAFFSILLPDRVKLYYFCVRLLILLPAISTYIFLLRIKCHVALAFSIAFLGFFSWINLGSTPHINHFYTSFLLSGALFCFGSSLENALIRFSLVLSIGCFIRPESGFSAILTLLLACIFQVRNHWPLQLRKGWLQFLIIGTISSGILIFEKGIIFNQKRSNIAFLQHYHLSIQEAGISESIWAKNHNIFTKDFKESSILWKAMLENPSVVKDHVLRNIKFLLEYLRFYPGDFLNGYALWKIPGIYGNKIGMVLLIIIFASSFYMSRIKKVSLPKEYLVAFILLGIASFPFLSACLLFHPRDHYQVPLFWFGICSFGLFISHSFPPKVYWIVSGLIVVVFLCTVPSYPYKINQKMGELVHFKTLQILKENGIKSGGLVSNSLFYQPYLGPDVSEVKMKNGQTPLMVYLKSENVQVIIADWIFKEKAKRYPEWAKLISMPEEFGYKLIKPSVKDGPDIFIRQN